MPKHAEVNLGAHPKKSWCCSPTYNVISHAAWCDVLQSDQAIIAGRRWLDGVGGVKYQGLAALLAASNTYQVGEKQLSRRVCHERCWLPACPPAPGAASSWIKRHAFQAQHKQISKTICRGKVEAVTKPLVRNELGLL